MIAITTLLAHLTQTEVTEICLRAGARPAARRDGALRDIDGEPVSADDLLRILFGAGGSRYVEALGQRPAQWRTRVEGVGAVNVSARMNGDVLEARFALRDPITGAAAPPPTPPPQRSRTPSIPPGKSKPSRASFRPLVDAEPAPTSSPTRRSRTGRAVRPSQATPPASPQALAAAPRDPPKAPARLVSGAAIELDIEIPSVPNPGDRAPPRRPPPLPPPARMPRVPADPPPLELKDDGADRGVRAPRASETGFAPITLPPATDEAPTPPPASPLPITRRGAEVRFQTPPRGVGRSTRPFGREPEPQLAALRELLHAARELGASDLHLVAGRPPLVRVAGQLVPRGDPIEARVLQDMISPRVPVRLAPILERDGSCDFALEDPDLGRFRVNVSRQRTGLKASLRLISPEVPTLATLGLPAAIGAATHHHQGLIVLTGPTGHGKTTTLAAVVDLMNAESSRHVITVEDPIEFIHPRKRAMMSQREVGTHTRSFHSALKAALREDPDVIVIGELRDTETVRIALEASETGHLVLGTMSTPSASKAIDRLIDLFPPADQQQVRMTLAGGLRLLVSQRLLPDVTGKAMVAAAELLPGIVPLWNLIRDNRTYQIPSLQQRGKELGVIRLDDSLRDLVRAGRVTAAAAVAVAESPDELEQVLAGRDGGHPQPPGRPRVPDSRPEAPPQAPQGAGTGAKAIFDRVFKKGG